MGKPVNAAKIKTLREQLGMNQDAFAAHCGISKRTVGRMEDGASVALTTVKAVARKLQIADWADLLGRESAEPAAAPTKFSWPRRSTHDRLWRYLDAVRAQFGHVAPIVANNSSNVVPMALVDAFVEPLLATREVEPNDEERLYTLGEPLSKILAKHSRLVVLGPGGMGKSTIVAWVADHLADPAPRPLRSALGDLIPLPLILRDLAIDGPVTWDALLAAFRATHLGQSLDDREWTLLLEEMTAGRVYVFLDGFDEIAGTERRAEYVRAIYEGIARHGGCRWMTTSRVIGYEFAAVDPLEPRAEAGESTEEREFRHKEDVKRVFDQQRYYVLPFDLGRIREYVERWYADPRNEDAAQEAADRLVRAIQENANTLQLARVPYLLALAAVLHRNEGVLPNGRDELYRRIAEGCVFTIPTKRHLPVVPVPVDLQLRWWGAVGYEMQCRRTPEDGPSRGLVSLGAAELRRALEGAWTDSPPPPSSGERADLFERIVDHMKFRAGLLTESDDGQFRFVHLSFQEFFAAWHLAGQVGRRSWWKDAKNIEALREKTGLAHWNETFVLLFDILSKSPDPGLTVELALDLFPSLDPAKLGKGTVPHAAALLLQMLGTDTCIRWQDPDLPGRATEAYTNWLIDSKRGETEREALDILDLDGTAVSDLRPLQALTQLQMLSLRQTAVSDLRPLQTLIQLQYLYIRQTAVSDLRPLQTLTQLLSLSLQRTAVSDLLPLQALTRLQTLDLDQTTVSDLRPLQALTRLQTLFLSQTAVSDLRPLQALTHLQALYLDQTAVSDLRPLQALTQLEWLSLRQTAVSDDQVRELEKALPNLSIDR